MKKENHKKLPWNTPRVVRLNHGATVQSAMNIGMVEAYTFIGGGSLDAGGNTTYNADICVSGTMNENRQFMFENAGSTQAVNAELGFCS